MLLDMRVLPAQPLLDALEQRQAQGETGWWNNKRLYRALCRARKDGWLTMRTADELAIHYLKQHPAEIWGADTWINQ